MKKLQSGERAQDILVRLADDMVGSGDSADLVEIVEILDEEEKLMARVVEALERVAAIYSDLDRTPSELANSLDRKWLNTILAEAHNIETKGK